MMRTVISIYLMTVLLPLLPCLDNRYLYAADEVYPERAPIVALFSFVDADENNVMLGPVRLIGTDDEATFCTMLAPFTSSFWSCPLFHRGASDERVVAMYIAERGFSSFHPACWRFCTMSAKPDAGCELTLEINYSYRIESALGSGYVEGMERLPLCNFPEATPVKLPNETLPFTVICIFVRSFNVYYI